MHKQHFDGLDGLRGIAAVSVVIFHASAWIPNFHVLYHAHLAVDFFFMLSGFVIDYAYRSRLRNAMTFAAFARARVVRLYPLIVAAAIVGLAASMLRAHLALPDGRWVDVVAFPFAALALPAPFFEPNPFLLNPAAWSLFFELVANAVFALGLFKLSTRPLAVVTALLGVAYAWMAWQTGTLFHGNKASDLWLGFVRVPFPFAMGMLLHRVRPPGQRFGLPYWVLCLMLIVTFLDIRPEQRNWKYEIVVVAGIYPLVILGAQAIHLQTRWREAARVSGFFSYPIYILHYPILLLGEICNQAFGLPWQLWMSVTFATIVVVTWLGAVWDVRVRALIDARWRFAPREPRATAA